MGRTGESCLPLERYKLVISPLCLQRASTLQSYWEETNSAGKKDTMFSVLWVSRGCFLPQLLNDFCTKHLE